MNKAFLQSKVFCFIVISIIFSVSLAWAEYPDRPIRMICGWPAGGSGDLPTRAICEPVAKLLKQPIIVENMPGATGTKSYAMISSAGPDGYTLGFVITTGITEKPHVMSVSYDPIKGFTPIMLFGWYTQAAVVRKDSPWKTFKDFIEYAKANPGKVKYGTTGHASTVHLFMERLQIVVPGLKMVAVPFQGGVPLMTAVLGGHVDIGVTAGECKPFVESGEVRMLASLNTKRWKSFPDVPTVQELGYPVAAESGLAISGPAGLPTAIRTKLQESFKEAMKDKDFLETMKNFELIVDYMPGPELEAFYRKKFEETGQTVKSLPK